LPYGHRKRRQTRRPKRSHARKTPLARAIHYGIGTGYIVDQRIDPALRNNEGGNLLLEHQGHYRRWEDFASGSAIVKQFGKQMKEINDEQSLRTIARNIAIGLIDLIAVLTPDIVVIGGSVGRYFDKYGKFLQEYLEKYDNPLIQLPQLKAAERPDDAVIYGCYDQAKQIFG
jgi:predicted NBD/HSP70 family sugar kinase